MTLKNFKGHTGYLIDYKSYPIALGLGPEIINKKKLDQPPSHVTHLVTCLTADPGVTNSIPARTRTFVKIDHEIISTAILFPSTDSKSGCQLQAKVCAQSTGNPLSQACPGKSVVR